MPAEVSLDRESIVDTLTTFVRERLLDEDDDLALTGDTPLLESGVLNSVGTAALIAFLRDEYGVRITADKVTGRHFRTLHAVADLVLTLR